MARRARIDMRRVAASAVETALNGQPHRRRFSGAKALATGVVLATAARVAVSKAHVPGLERLSELGDDLKDRLAEQGWLGEDADDQADVDDAAEIDDEEDLDEDEDLDEEDLDDEDEDEDGGDEPEDEGDGGGEAEAGDEEWDEEDDGGEDEDDDYEDADYEDDVEPEEEEPAAASTPSLMDVLGDHASPPPLRRASNGRGRRVDPAARPPEPPSKPKSKSKAGAR